MDENLNSLFLGIKCSHFKEWQGTRNYWETHHIEVMSVHLFFCSVEIQQLIKKGMFYDSKYTISLRKFTNSQLEKKARFIVQKQ